MAICKRCGADDLLNSDLCGDAGCVYCYGTPMSELVSETKESDSYTIVLTKEKKCPKCGRKTYLVKESGTCEQCYLKRGR